MTSSTSDGSPAASAPQLLYLEERWFTLTQAIVMSAIISLPIIMFSASWVDVGVATVAASAGLILLPIVLFLSPYSVGFSHIHISEAGLALWWGQQRKLPARELGAAYVLEEADACAAARQGRHRGIKIPMGRCSYWMGGGDGPAVFVEQERPGKDIVGWLLATREPDAVIEAVAEARDRRRDD